MKALRTLTVTSELPAELEGLRTLAYNLRWSWNAETRDLFEALDPEFHRKVRDRGLARGILLEPAIRGHVAIKLQEALVKSSP